MPQTATRVEKLVSVVTDDKPEAMLGYVLLHAVSEVIKTFMYRYQINEYDNGFTVTFWTEGIRMEVSAEDGEVIVTAAEQYYRSVLLSVSASEKVSEFTAKTAISKFAAEVIRTLSTDKLEKVPDPTSRFCLSKHDKLPRNSKVWVSEAKEDDGRKLDGLWWCPAGCGLILFEETAEALTEPFS